MLTNPPCAARNPPRYSDRGMLFYSTCCDHPDLHSFPTRRSSDLPDTSVPPAEQQRRREGMIILSAALAVLLFAFFETRSEEHTSELQSRRELVCRLLLEKKK